MTTFSNLILFQEKNPVSTKGLTCVLFTFFSFRILWCFDIWKTFWLEKVLFPGAGAFWETAQDPAGRMPWICTLTTPQPYLPSWPLHSCWQYSSALITPGPGARRWRTTPTTESLPKLFKLANPKLMTLLCLVFLVETAVKAKAYMLPSLLPLLPPYQRWCFPLRFCVALLLSLGPLSIINFVFLSRLLRPHLNDHLLE